MKRRETSRGKEQSRESKDVRLTRHLAVLPFCTCHERSEARTSQDVTAAAVVAEAGKAVVVVAEVGKAVELAQASTKQVWPSGPSLLSSSASLQEAAQSQLQRSSSKKERPQKILL